MLSVKVFHRYGATWHHSNNLVPFALEFIELGERAVLELFRTGQMKEGR